MVRSFALGLLLLAALAARAAEGAPTVVLKLDDVTKIWPWDKVVDYLAEQKIKAGFGIICQSLEKDDPPYFAWVKKLHAGGQVEFWCHGYKLRGPKDQGEFESGTAAEQQAVFERCQALAQEKLGFAFATFSPHWSGTTAETATALQAVPSFTLWMYGPRQPSAWKRAILERPLNLENPTFVPDYDKFTGAYAKSGRGQRVLCLQGHPPSWNEERWAGFRRIIAFLKEQGCAFATPSEAAALAATAP